MIGKELKSNLLLQLLQMSGELRSIGQHVGFLVESEKLSLCVIFNN